MMFYDDKIGLGYGLLGLLQDDAKFVTCNGQAWILDETILTKHLKAIADAGANFVRLLPWGVWGTHKYGKASQFQPYFLDTSRDKWDLSAFNTHYFPILKRVIEIINGLNMTVIWPFFDACQFHGAYSKWSPWVSNVQGISTLYDPDADVYTKRWVSTMTLRFKDADIIWAFGNEMNNAAFPAFAKRVIFPYIKLRNLDFNRMTYGATTNVSAGDSIQDTVRISVRDTFGPIAEKNMMMEDHGYPFAASLPVWGNKPWRKIYSDDGFYGGKSLCDKRDKGARPSAVEWGARAKYILDHYPSSGLGRSRLISFEHLPGVYPPDTVCQTATIKAISGAYRTKFGAWPKNWGKYGG
jgi:hypothetical protein